MMTCDTGRRSQIDQPRRSDAADLDRHYGRIGISAVAAAARYPSNPAATATTAAPEERKDPAD
jgi:hypothetical protein